MKQPSLIKLPVSLVENTWYGTNLLTLCFIPASFIFWLISVSRRIYYKLRRVKPLSDLAPIIIVGNITVGGTGKTSLTIWLANFLKDNGFRPGIICSGYGGMSNDWPEVIENDSKAISVGDESILLYRNTGCPVVAGPERIISAKKLLDNHSCNVILSDDGLQHYALPRNIEIAVRDGRRGEGNGLMLPAGPLREPKSRLKTVDYIVASGRSDCEEILMTYQVLGFFNLKNRSKQFSLENYDGRPVYGVAALGNNAAFFNLLREQGLVVIEKSFHDHHHFCRSDFPNTSVSPVFMSEKDAMKCEDFVEDNWWYVKVTPMLSERFGYDVIKKIEKKEKNG